MLTDTKLKNLKPAEKAYKVPDRDGMYATVLPSGTISFRYNYRVNGRYETLVLGRYGGRWLEFARGEGAPAGREESAIGRQVPVAPQSPIAQSAGRWRTIQRVGRTLANKVQNGGVDAGYAALGVRTRSETSIW